MKLHNPLNGVQIDVDDDTGERLLEVGTYREGPTPANWKAPKRGQAPAEPVVEDQDADAGDDGDEKPKETAAQKRKREAEEKAEREAAEKAAAEAAAAGNGN